MFINFPIKKIFIWVIILIKCSLLRFRPYFILLLRFLLSVGCIVLSRFKLELYLIWINTANLLRKLLIINLFNSKEKVVKFNIDTWVMRTHKFIYLWLNLYTSSILGLILLSLKLFWNSWDVIWRFKKAMTMLWTWSSLCSGTL